MTLKFPMIATGALIAVAAATGLMLTSAASGHVPAVHEHGVTTMMAMENGNVLVGCADGSVSIITPDNLDRELSLSDRYHLAPCQ